MFLYINSFCLHEQPYFIDEETEAETLNYVLKACLVNKDWGQDLNSGSLIPEPALVFPVTPISGNWPGGKRVAF